MSRYLPPAWFWLALGLLWGTSAMFDGNQSASRHDSVMFLLCVAITYAASNKPKDES